MLKTEYMSLYKLHSWFSKIRSQWYKILFDLTTIKKNEPVYFSSELIFNYYVATNL